MWFLTYLFSEKTPSTEVPEWSLFTRAGALISALALRERSKSLGSLSHTVLPIFIALLNLSVIFPLSSGIYFISVAGVYIVKKYFVFMELLEKTSA